MAQALRNYIQDVEKARKELNKVLGSQLQSQKRRDGLRLIVERYFGEIRPSVVSAQEQNESIKQADDNMQELLSMCHKKGSVKSYRYLLANIKKSLIAIDAQVVSSVAPAANNRQMDATDEQIVNTLQSIVLAAALSYQQAIADLQSDSRLSWRGPATDLREALRETLDYLAPDAAVKEVPGYKQSPDTHGPTMKQKVQFIMRNRGKSKTVAATAEAAVVGIEDAMGTFVRSVYSRSNVSTHTPTDKSEVLRVRDLVRVVLCELLEIHT
jgi:hypothetical protein